MQTQKISYKRHRFPPQIIAHVVWLYVRFNLSLRGCCNVNSRNSASRGTDGTSSDIRRGFPHLESFEPMVANGEGGTTAGWYGEGITGCGLHRNEALQSTR